MEVAPKRRESSHERRDGTESLGSVQIHNGNRRVDGEIMSGGERDENRCAMRDTERESMERRAT